MTEFSALRSSAGFELFDIAQQFDASFPSVARWETGAEDAPERASQDIFMREPWGMLNESKPSPAPRRRSPRPRGHARTEGKGRTNPVIEDG